MNPFSGFTTAAWWISGALAAALAVTGAIAWGLAARASTLETERDLWQQAADDRAKANAAFQQAVPALIDRLRAEVGRNQEIASALETADARAATLQRERDAARAAARERRGAIYATDATCAAWADAPVCAAISRELRDEWRAAGGR